MKVALLFFGQPRFVDNTEVEETYKKTIIDKYDTDIFCHMWWKSGENQEYDISSWSKMNTCPILPNAKELVYQKYNPILLIDEEPQQFKFSQKVQEFVDNKFTGRNPHHQVHRNNGNYNNILSQLFAIKTIATAFDTYQKTSTTKQKYDWIVLARYDTVIRDFPDLSSCDNNKFYLSHSHPRFPDLIQFFGPKFIDWAKDVYSDVDFVYKSIWEPSPEAFKKGSFLRKFNESDICPCPVDARAIRE